MYVFQFPNLFPKFSQPVIAATDGVGADGSDEKPDIKPDIKPTLAQLRSQKKRDEKPVEGRIGTLCVMKSGKVKMGMGDDIVMNVSAPLLYLHSRSPPEAPLASASHFRDLAWSQSLAAERPDV